MDRPEISGKGVKRLVAGGLTLAFLAAAGLGSFYTVDPSERANLRRLGNIAYSEPVGAGTHLKFPFIDKVDKIQVSLTTLHIPAFDVNTIDNQKITLEINFNYTVPMGKVNHLLYEVGKSGHMDLDESIIPVAKDRAARVFAQQNTTTVSQNREAIQAKVEKDVADAVRDLFGIEPHSLQIASIGYSKAFIESNENAVKAKNDAVAEQNKQVVETAKAQQKVIAAKGEADAEIERATGSARAAVIAAEADKQKQVLDGEGQGARLKAEIAALGSPENYIRYMDTKAKNLWDGKAPYVQSGPGGSSPTVVVPIPAPNPPGGPK
ncbi:MAG: prohibitin family protein [Alphaproteobacteria bacterium]|nr:MAG: prohibitin family protein [Alphaproteobacteria bacterium]